MAAIASFVIRLVGFAVLLAIADRVAEYLWVRDALDQIADLQPWHDTGFTILGIAPLLLALVAIVQRRLAFGLAFVLVGAALTAPFAFARLVQ